MLGGDEISFLPGALMISCEVTGRSTNEYAQHGMIALCLQSDIQTLCSVMKTDPPRVCFQTRGDITGAQLLLKS